MHPRGIIGFAAALSLAAALAACQSVPDEIETETQSNKMPSASAGPEAPATGDVASPGQVIQAGAGPRGLAALPPEPPEPPEPAIDDDPQQLYGLNSQALGAVLGEPSLIRREAPAAIWQYRSQTCVFDVFLYDQAGGARVTFIEARDDAAHRIDARGCLNELLRVRMGLPLG